MACVSGTMVQCSIRSSKEWQNAAAGLGQPNEFSQESAGPSPGEGTSGKGEPLQNNTIIVARESRDCPESRFDEHAKNSSRRGRF